MSNENKFPLKISRPPSEPPEIDKSLLILRDKILKQRPAKAHTQGGVPICMGLGIHERDTQQIPGRLAGATRDAQKRVTVRRTESVACGRVAPAGSHTYIQEIS